MHIHLHMYIASTLSILRVLQPYEKIVLVYIIDTCKNDIQLSIARKTTSTSRPPVLYLMQLFIRCDIFSIST